ncbi:MAG: hypothetical protein VKO26_02875 [Cyanobacteriota bacterium]|nr:hypothetical protein [Cyanobacteriota bacterium]
MAACTTPSPPWDIRSDLPGRLRLIWDPLRESPDLRRQCGLALTACHWLHGFRLNGLAGSLCLRFPEARRADLADLLTAALAPPATPPPASAPGAIRRAQPLLLRHGTLCVLALGLDLWLGLPALLVNGAAALLTLPLLAHAWRDLRRRPPGWSELLNVSFAALLLRQGLGREVLVDQALEDGGEWLQRLENEGTTRQQAELDVLRRLGSEVRVNPAAGDDPLPLAAVGLHTSLRLAPGTTVFLPMDLVEGNLAVIRPGGRGIWEPCAVTPGDRLEPGWLVAQGEGIGQVLCTFAEDVRFQRPAIPARPAATDTLMPRLLRLHAWLVEPLLLTVGGFWALGGQTERAMAAFQFNPLSDWQASQTALRLVTQEDMRLHGLHIAHPRVLVELARVDRLLVSPGCWHRLERLEPRERLPASSDTRPGDLIGLLANLERHLARQRSDPDSSGAIPAESDAWMPRQVTCLEEGQGWRLELPEGRQLTVRPNQPDPLAGEILAVWDGDTCLGEVLLERRPNALWKEVGDHLERLGIDVIPLEAPETDADDITWRLDAVTTLQRQGCVVAWLGDDLADLPAMTQADVAIGLRLQNSHRLPLTLFDVTLGEDPLWLPRLVGWSRELTRVSKANLWLIGLTHVLSSLATAGLAITPFQAVLLADLPLLLAELNNRRANRFTPRR